MYVNREQEQAVEYIRAHTSGDEAIFVGNRRHDLIFVNDISFYFLADRPSATYYHELYPGVATTQAVQERIVEDMRTKNVSWAVLVDIWESSEPNASSISSGVHFLDDYIRSTMRPIATFGMYEVWKKKGTK